MIATAGTVAALVALLACASQATPIVSGPGDGAADAGAEGSFSDAFDLSFLGVSCVPAPELSPAFGGFSENEVTVDQGNAACGGLTCLVNHFRGLTSCPYGQNANGTGVAPAPPCAVPGTDAAVTPNDPSTQEQIAAQCTDRTASAAVYCTCRCANAEGNIDDGAKYCACPTGYACTTNIVPTLVSGDPNAGAYCIRENTAFDPSNNCASECAPGTAPCAATPVAQLGDSANGGSTTYILAVITPNNAACFPRALPTRALPAQGSGLAACNVFYVITQGDTCAAHAGLTDADPDVATTIRATAATGASVPVCVLAELTGACAASSQAGWCYEVAPIAPNACAEALQFSATGMPPAGATAFLACP